MVAVAILLAVAAVVFSGPQERVRPCGHPRDVLWEINPFRATHCCNSGRTVADLVSLYHAQFLYRGEHGTFATSLAQLSNLGSHSSSDYGFSLVGDGQRWSITVAQQAGLAGSYLLTSEGRIHFKRTGTVTTNDTVLTLVR